MYSEVDCLWSLVHIFDLKCKSIFTVLRLSSKLSKPAMLVEVQAVFLFQIQPAFIFCCKQTEKEGSHVLDNFLLDSF